MSDFVERLTTNRNIVKTILVLILLVGAAVLFLQAGVLVGTALSQVCSGSGSYSCVERECVYSPGGATCISYTQTFPWTCFYESSVNACLRWRAPDPSWCIISSTGACSDQPCSYQTGNISITTSCPGSGGGCSADTTNYGQGAACTSAGGTCQNECRESCSGSYQSGLCPGPSYYRCCIPPAEPMSASLTVNVNGAPSASITASPHGVGFCGRSFTARRTCDSAAGLGIGWHDHGAAGRGGTIVTAPVISGYTFTGWSGDNWADGRIHCTGMTSRDRCVNIPPGESGNITANYEPEPSTNTIRFTSTPITGVRVDYTGGNCSTNCSYSTDTDYNGTFSISVRDPFINGGDTYNFVRWEIDGWIRTANKTLISLNDSWSNRDAVAVYTLGPPPPPPPINGSCGPAARNYASGDSSYSGALCSAGTASPSSPSFPSAGGSTSWTCLGANGGSNASCLATRDSAVCRGTWVNGACGGGSCSSDRRHQTRTVVPPGCGPTSRCEPDPACAPLPLCTPGSWVNGACGGGSCSSDRRQQTRTVSPPGCARSSRCEPDPACAPVPVNLTVALSARPSSGNAPLTSTLTANVGGTAAGTINYTFYCNRFDNGTNVTSGWNAKFDGVSATTRSTTCTYSSQGTPTAKVIVERASLADEERRDITVTQPLPSVSISALPSSIVRGLGSSEIRWNSSNANSCTVNPGGGSGTSGSMTVTPITDTTYTANCSGPGGSASDSVLVTVVVPAPEITEFKAVPAVVFKGGQTTLSWIVENIVTGDVGCSINQGIGSVPPPPPPSPPYSEIVTPPGTITYTLTCRNPGGTDSASVTVTVPFLEEVLP